MPDKKKELDRQLNEPPEGEEEEEVETGFVEIEGEKFKEDPDNPGEALADEEGNAIPFEEEKKEEEVVEEEEGFVEIEGVKYKEDPENKGEALKDDEDKPIPFVVDEASKKKKDRWHGKSREEVIKEFEELEQKKEKEPVKPEEKKPGEEEEEGFKMPSDEEIKKMTPGKFAKMIFAEIDKRITKSQDERSVATSAVTKEINEAKKDHPLLNTNAGYRELVLALINAASSKGKDIPLKEACEKVDALVGKEKGVEEISKKEEDRLKKAKAQIEKEETAPTPGTKPGKEAERIAKALKTGSSESPLGGL